MSRILAVDYGQKRVGIAVTDPMRIIATALDTVAATDAEDFIAGYCAQNDVGIIVIGLPTQPNGQPSESQRYIRPFAGRLKKRLPHIEFAWEDERYTSVIAQQTMIDVGIKKMARRDKGTVDRISAVLILQSFLERSQSINL